MPFLFVRALRVKKRTRYPTLSHAIPRLPTLSHAIPRYPTLSHAIPRYPTLSPTLSPTRARYHTASALIAWGSVGSPPRSPPLAAESRRRPLNRHRLGRLRGAWPPLVHNNPWDGAEILRIGLGYNRVYYIKSGGYKDAHQGNRVGLDKHLKV